MGSRMMAGSICRPTWPVLSAADLTSLRGMSYAEIALRVITPFLDGIVAPRQWEKMIADSYADFDDPAVAPLKALGDGFWLEELFHGPTLAFKDYALQLVGRLFDYVLAQRGARVTIVGATSGDTGSAAIEACRDRGAGRHLHPLSAGPHLRGAAPADDDGRGGQRPCHRRSRAPSTIARTW